MAFADKKGITVASGFKLQAATPIDARFTVDTLEDRDELVTLQAVYPGLVVYVSTTKEQYIYHTDGTWSLATSAEAPTINELSTTDIDDICV